MPDPFSLLQRHAEGKELSSSDVETSNKVSSNPVFARMIVLDVITDPNNDLKDPLRKSYWASWGVSNVKVLQDVVPRNTIIAKKINSDDSPMFVLPFFPSHLSLPCKPGECVWVMFEMPDRMSEIAFWFCKTTDSHTSDDVNHTHPGRAFETTMFPGSVDLFNNSSSPPDAQGSEVWHELRNSPVMKYGDDRMSVATNMILKGLPEDIFETLILKSDSSKLTVYESVPRFRKRPGDLVLEGTNNALISIGTDRVGPAAAYVPATEEVDKVLKTQIPKIPDTDLTSQAGAIDIVVGRGQLEETFGKEAETTRIADAKGKTKGTVLKKELNKAPSVMAPREGDPDFANDRSRILVSQRTKVDTNFGLKSYNEAKTGTGINPADVKVKDSEKGDASIVIKSDKIRLIARSDVQIIVTNFTEGTAPDKQSFKKDEPDQKKWASVTIKSNGDIVFSPSEQGFIKLGGDDADLGIVCTDAPATATNGTVSSAAGIQTPMGGPFAITTPAGTAKNAAAVAGMGKVASKVLIK